MPKLPLAAWLLACAGAAHAQSPQAPQPLALADALSQARGVAASVRSADLHAQAQQLRAEALGRLDWPTLSLGGFVGRLSNTLTVDTSGLAAALNPTIDMLGAVFPGAALAPVPNQVVSERTTNLGSVGLSSAWALYTGGRITALQDLAAGRAREAEVERTEAEEQLSTLVAQRYFTVQLARQAVALRADATAGIAEHRRAAGLLESQGLIARTERLRADVALDGARRDEARARSDLALAELALQRLVDAPQPVQPLTPLFVLSQGAGPLQDFVEAAMAHHPAWGKLAAKREQADASLRLSSAQGKPNVAALAHHNFSGLTQSMLQPNWQVGIAVSLPIFAPVDSGRLREAARLEQQRVEASAAQAQRDIPTLVESNWRAVENTRAQFQATGSAIELAREQLRLARIGFQHAQATSIDVTDAQLGLAKAQIERSQAAFDHVMALARLLEACGQPQRLPELAAQADLRIE